MSALPDDLRERAIALIEQMDWSKIRTDLQVLERAIREVTCATLPERRPVIEETVPRSEIAADAFEALEGYDERPRHLYIGHCVQQIADHFEGGEGGDLFPWESPMSLRALLDGLDEIQRVNERAAAMSSGCEPRHGTP